MRNEDLRFINNALYKASKYRFELRVSKNDILYLYDKDEVGFDRIVRRKAEFKDIMSCMNLQEFTDDKERMQNLLERMGVI